MFRTITPLLAALVLLFTSCTSRGPEQADQATTADEMPPEDASMYDIQSEEFSYEAGGAMLTGYLAYDAAMPGERPGVLVVHEWWGHNDYARMRAEKLAKMGYTALALDMFGDGKVTGHPDSAGAFVQEFMENLETGMARFEAAHALLDEHQTTDPTQTAAIGYCFGGGIVLNMARAGMDLAAVASFHGGLTAEVPAVSPLNTRFFVAHGSDDPMVPPLQVAAFKEEMEGLGADLTFLEYPGATHGFTNPGATEIGQTFGIPIAYDAAADSASWAELEVFLGDTFYQ